MNDHTYDKTFTNAQIFAPNFRGLISEQNPKGRRWFALILPDDVGPDMWQIRTHRTDDGIEIPYTNVKIPEDFDFSKITLDGRPFSENDDFAVLDLAKNLECDVHIVGRPWRYDAADGEHYSGVHSILVSLDARTV